MSPCKLEKQTIQKGKFPSLDMPISKMQSLLFPSSSKQNQSEPANQPAEMRHKSSDMMEPNHRKLDQGWFLKGQTLAQTTAKTVVPNLSFQTNLKQPKQTLVQTTAKTVVPDNRFETSNQPDDSESSATNKPFNPSWGYFANLGLSPEAKKVMQETSAQAKTVLAKMKSESNLQASTLSPSSHPNRRIAKPKSRFSDVHDASFKKMDSIANHPSTWRLGKGPVKAGSTESSNVAHQQAKAKRSISQDDSTEDAAPNAKRIKHSDSSRLLSQAKQKSRQPDRAVTRVKPNSLFSPTKASLARSKSVQNLKSPAKSKIPALASVNDLFATANSSADKFSYGSSNPKAWNVKQPSWMSSQLGKPSPAATWNNIVANNRDDVPMYPSISVQPLQEMPSWQNAQDNDADHDTYMPTVPKSPEEKPRNTHFGTPAKLKSILRTPRRLYSNDPLKIAAGTHLATPPKDKASMRVPATAPVGGKVIKHVGFTASTIQRAESEEAKPTYPDLSSIVSPHRMTLDAPTSQAISMSSPAYPQDPSQFTFRVGSKITFATIRPVRISDSQPSYVPSASSAKKRKAEENLCRDVDEILDQVSEKEKENNRPVKKPKLKHGVASKPAQHSLIPVSPRKLVKQTSIQARKSDIRKVTTAEIMGTKGISTSRLAYLAQPKRR
jgi:hypothetical protein